MQPDDVQLDDVSRHRHVIPLLAEWHVREWQHLYPAWTMEAAQDELEASTSRGIPHTIVAFSGDRRTEDDVLGSVSLIADDELAGFEDVGPWLASLFVRPSARGAGVGRALVAALVADAADIGVERLHLFHTDSTDFYTRLGWHVVATTDQHGHAVTVMARHTHPHAPRRAFAADWCTNPWFRCAYSYLRPHGTPSDRDLIGAPIAPGLVLAGEAASRDHPGTVHGAWFSGQHAAEQVLPSSPGHVVVVGAGMAGIAAARTARAAGAAVTVLEATSRIGGRATSSRALGGPVNVGAAWIHGTEGHPLFPGLSRRTAISDTNTFRQMTTFVAGDGELTGARLAQLDRMQSEIAARIDAAARVATPRECVGDVLYPAIADVASDDVAAVVLRSWLRGEYENLYAAPPSDLSLIHHSEPFRLPGDDVMITVASDELVAELAGDLPIAYETPVTAIVRDGDSWRVRTAESERTADAVVVTVSIGVLHAGSIEFDPPLPEPVQDALGRIGAGLVTKAFFSFDEAFWAPRRAFWVAAEPPALFELWVDVTSVRGAPTLCAFAVGEDARLVEAMTEDEVLAAGWTVLTSAPGIVPVDARHSRG